MSVSVLRIASPSSVLGPGWRDDARVRRLPDGRLELVWRGPPRIVPGVSPDWAGIDRYVECERGRVSDFAAQ
jgi:hypothetical protein